MSNSGAALIEIFNANRHSHTVAQVIFSYREHIESRQLANVQAETRVGTVTHDSWFGPTNNKAVKTLANTGQYMAKFVAKARIQEYVNHPEKLGEDINTVIRFFNNFN